MKLRSFLVGFLGLFILASTAAHAESYDTKDITYTVSPIIGYEMQKKENPTRTKLELTYGVRVVAGYKILSAEGEYTQGKSSEDFFAPVEHIEEKTEKIRVGLRSTYSLGSMLDWTLRGGAEDQKIHTSTTISGTTTESDSPSKVYPYVGTELSIALGSTLSLNGGILATLKDLNDFKKTELTTTFGIKIALNTGR
jgi:hypothetical protein